MRLNNREYSEPEPKGRNRREVMDRRKFLVKCLAGLGCAAISGTSLEASSEPDVNASKFKFQYIREKIPTFEIPPFRGDRYEDSVPDTLDIAERTKLAIHAMTSITDPEADSEIFWFVDIFRNPVVMRHDMSDWVQLISNFMEVLPLVRNATGESLNDHVDPVWMKAALKSLGPDGLYYFPLNGRPWSRYKYMIGNLSETDPVWRPDGTTTNFLDQSIAQITTGEVCGGALSTLAAYYSRDKNPIWGEAGKRMVNRLSAVAIQKDDYAYLTGAWEPNAKVSRTVEMPLGFLAEEWNSWTIQGLAKFYNATGYEPALQLAGKITRFYRYHTQYYDRDGRFLFDERTKKMFKQLANTSAPTVGGHGHAHTYGLLSMLEYAVGANDRETMDFVRTSYDWIKQQNSPFGVSTLVGWFPEWYVPYYVDCETDTIADMLALAVKMSELGLGDYWDDLDRWLRNQFAAQQITPDLVESIHRFSESRPRKPLGPFETADNVVERNVGAWSGWAGPSDWAIKMGIQHCCTGNSSRSLYYVLEHMVEFRNDELRVNLLMNRGARWADVYSHVPYQGRVDLKIKENCRNAALRAPEWVSSHSPEIQCQVNGISRALRWDARYVTTGPLNAGDRVRLTFPITERTVKEQIGSGSYTLELKGNTVLSIDPPGKNVPIYQDRAKYRTSEVQWKKVERFVPREEIAW